MEESYPTSPLTARTFPGAFAVELRNGKLQSKTGCITRQNPILFISSVMKSFRSNITKLRNALKAKLPKGSDLYGYAGVSSDMIEEALDEAYSLSALIEELELGGIQNFELISLKRKASSLFPIMNEFLENDAESSKATKKFNQFLNALSELLEKIKLAYISTANDQLQPEKQYGHLTDQISKLSAEKERFEGVLESYSSNLESATQQISVIDSAYNEIDEKIERFESYISNGESVNLRSEQVAADAATWDEQISERDSRITSQESKLEKAAAETAELRHKLETVLKNSETIQTQIKERNKEIREIATEIKAHLGDANRIGMAGSFKTRKEELEKTHANWQRIFITTIVVITSLSGYFLFSAEANEIPDWRMLILRVAMVAPLVWLAWFAARQYGTINRVREDYSFKYASSMAYEGFKKATREVDPELEQTLLEVSILNMSQNPIRLLDSRKDYSTPTEELGENLQGRLKKLKSIAAKDPTGNEISVNMDPEE
ncbi:MAG: hypothetical protein AAGF67_04110 [Verrucomicrobiota bacterium]